jgi:branched-chain amino acid aminotransferase
MYYGKGTIVFHDGAFEKATEAQTDLFSQSMHYGHGIVEGLRAYDTDLGPHIFKAKEHYERLLLAAQRLHLNVKFDVDELVHYTYQLLERNHILSNAYIRPMIYVGASMSLVPSTEAKVFIAAWKWAGYLDKDLIDVSVSSLQRPNPKATFVDYKLSGHYVNYIYAMAEARARGFEDALMLDMNGHVAQASASNFFYQKDGKLYTAPRGHIMPGITRSVVFDMARELGYEVVERDSTLAEVLQADGAFITSTTVEIKGVSGIDGQRFRLPWHETIGYELLLKYKQLVSQSHYDTYAII